MRENSKYLILFIGVILFAVVCSLTFLAPMQITPLPTPTPTYPPTPTEIVNKVMVVYQDGQKVDIADWEFKYMFSWKRTKPQGNFVYDLDAESSKDLHLQTVTVTGSATLTEEIVITANELERIRYMWPTGEGNSAPTIVILTKSGKEYTSSLDQLIAFDQDRVVASDSYFVISDLFLSPAGYYVFAKKLYLVGRVRQDGQWERLELELFAWYLDRYYEEIVFP